MITARTWWGRFTSQFSRTQSVREPPRELGGGGSRTSSRTQFANRRFNAGSPDSVRSSPKNRVLCGLDLLLLQPGYMLLRTSCKKSVVQNPPKTAKNAVQCRNFTGMRPVFGDILISFGVVWYSGMRKWYAGFTMITCSGCRCGPAGARNPKPCVQKCRGCTALLPGYTRVFPGMYVSKERSQL